MCLYKILIFILVLYGCEACRRCFPDEPIEQNMVATDPDDFIQTELRYRLEYIKMQILHKLGLSRAPKVKKRNVDIAMYSQLLESSLTQPQPAPSVENEKIFIFPLKKLTFTFNLTLSQLKKPFKRILLSLKNPSEEDDSATILQIRTAFNTSYQRILGKVSPTGKNQEWKEYDLTNLLISAYPDEKENHLITVETDTFKPSALFITIELEYSTSQRKKRKMNWCGTTGNASGCCREMFYVNFTQVGWDNWIVQPHGYYANYCKGECDLQHGRYSHSTVVQKYSSVIKLCCSPREMSTISLIYLNGQGLLFKKNLANMVVESCDCA